MKRENIKHILFSSFQELSQGEQQMARKFLFSILGILSLILATSYLYDSITNHKTLSPSLENTDIIYFSLLLFTSFTFFHLAFKKRYFHFLKLFTFFIFISLLLYVGFLCGSILFKTTGLLSFLGWLVYFIRSVFYPAKDILTGKDEAQFGEEAVTKTPRKS